MKIFFYFFFFYICCVEKTIHIEQTQSKEVCHPIKNFHNNLMSKQKVLKKLPNINQTKGEKAKLNLNIFDVSMQQKVKILSSILTRIRIMMINGPSKTLLNDGECLHAAQQTIKNFKKFSTSNKFDIKICYKYKRGQVFNNKNLVYHALVCIKIKDHPSNPIIFIYDVFTNTFEIYETLIKNKNILLDISPKGEISGLNLPKKRILTQVHDNFIVNDDISTLNSSNKIIDAALLNSAFVVVWQQYSNSTDDNDIFARIFTLSSQPIEASFRVNIEIGGSQKNPRVATLIGGGFIVVWEGFLQGYHSNYAISFRIFNDNGTAIQKYMNNQSQIISSSDRYCDCPQLSIKKYGNITISYILHTSYYYYYFYKEIDQLGNQLLSNKTISGPLLLDILISPHLYSFNNGKLKILYIQVSTVLYSADIDVNGKFNNVMVKDNENLTFALYIPMADDGFVIACAYFNQMLTNYQAYSFAFFNADGSTKLVNNSAWNYIGYDNSTRNSYYFSNGSNSITMANISNGGLFIAKEFCNSSKFCNIFNSYL